MQRGSLFQGKPVRNLGFRVFLHFRGMETLNTHSVISVHKLGVHVTALQRIESIALSLPKTAP